jgi:hypothetical protein
MNRIYPRSSAKSAVAKHFNSGASLFQVDSWSRRPSLGSTDATGVRGKKCYAHPKCVYETRRRAAASRAEALSNRAPIAR